MSDLVKFEDRVKERLKGIVADLIPEDRWAEIVRQTVQDFEKNDLPKLVKSELELNFKNMIQREFAKPEWASQWDPVLGQQASEQVQKLIVDAAPLILSSMLGQAAQTLMQQLQYSLQNQRY